MQQSEEYVLQIDAEIERLQQLREQVRMMTEGAEALDETETEAPPRRATRKRAAKKVAETRVPAKRGRPSNKPVVEA